MSAGAIPPPGVCTPDQLLPSGEPMIATPCMKWKNEQAGKVAKVAPAPAPDKAETPKEGKAAPELSFWDDPLGYVKESAREVIQGAVDAITPFDEIHESVEGAGKPAE